MMLVMNDRYVLTKGADAPDSISVSSLVAERIGRYNPNLANRWLELCCKNIIDGFSVSEQLEYINDFWRLRLSYFRIDTMDYRTSLGEVDNLNTWLDNFDHDILPVIMTHWNGL